MKRSPIKRKPRKKLQKPKNLKKKVWQAFAAYIRRRDPKCVTCGAPTTEAGHYKHNSERSQSFGGNALWYDERNVNGQCAKCNRWMSSNPVPYALFLEEKYGMGILQELNKLWQTPKKWTREELEAVYNRYRDLTYQPDDRNW